MLKIHKVLKRKAVNKGISFALSVVIVFNYCSYSFAQAIAADFQRQAFQAVESIKAYKETQKNNQEQVAEIAKTIQTQYLHSNSAAPSASAAREVAGSGTEEGGLGEMSFETFKKEYLSSVVGIFSKENKELDASYKKEREFLNSFFAQYPYVSMYDVQKSYGELDANYQSVKKKLGDENKSALLNLDQRYKEYVKEHETAVLKAYEEYMGGLKDLLARLFKLYLENPTDENVKSGLLVNCSRAAMEYVYEQDLFTKKQKEILLDLARKQLQAEKGTPCTRRGKCDAEFGSLDTLLLLSKDEYDVRSDAFLIAKFLQHARTSPAAAGLVLKGFGTILSMGVYNAAEVYIHTATLYENSVESIDVLSASAYAKLENTARGHYLGPASEGMQYSNNGAIQNAWYDIAFMLAEEGSRESLDMLRNYGVQKCTVNYDILTKKYSINFNGIIPFLHGALDAGKSGAEKYHIVSAQVGTQQMNGNGQISTVTKEEADSLAKRANISNGNLAAYSQKTGMRYDTLFALAILNKRLGDIGAKQEEEIDISLYARYGMDMRDEYINHQYAVVDKKSYDDRFLAGQFMERNIRQASIFDAAMFAILFVDLSRLAVRGIKMGKRLFMLLQKIRHGRGVNIGYLRKNLKAFQKIKALRISRVDIFNNYKQNLANGLGMSRPALFDRASAQNIAKLSVGRALKAAEGIKTGVESVLPTVTFDAKKGLFTADTKAAYLRSQSRMKIEVKIPDSGGTPIRHELGMPGGKVKEITETMSTLNKAVAEANRNSPKASIKGSQYRKTIANLVREDLYKTSAANTEKGLNTINDFLNDLSKGKGAFANFPKEISLYNPEVMAQAKTSGPISATFVSTTKGTVTPLNLDVSIGRKIPGVRTKDIGGIVFKEEKGKVTLNMIMRNGKEVTPSFFKTHLPEGGIKNWAEYASASGVDLNLKFAPEKGLNGFAKGLNTFGARYVPKDIRFGTNAPVFMSGNGGQIAKTGLTFDTGRQYKGISAVINETGNVLLKGVNKTLGIGKKSFWLPKKEFGNFTKMMAGSDIKKPLSLVINGSRNKINTLYFSSLISLGPASTSLISPLMENFENITNRQATTVTLLLPYAASFFSPVFTPFVKKYGAAKIFMASILTSTTALALNVSTGYSGFGGIHRGNENNPPLWPLLVSSGIIGASSALIRASSSPLMTTLAGGGGTLKSKALKNVSSFMMIIPPLLFSIPNIGKEKEYYTRPDGGLYLSSTNMPIEKKMTDFAIFSPIIGLLCLSVFARLKTANLPKFIGAEEGFKFYKATKAATPTFLNSAKGLGLETWRSLKPLTMKETLPALATAVLLNGAEGSLLYTYGIKRSDEKIRKVVNNNVWVPILAAATVASTALPFRLYSKKVLNLIGGESAIAYKRLFAFSTITAAAGGMIMYKSESTPWFYVGLGLTSLGFASGSGSLMYMGKSNIRAAGLSELMEVKYQIVDSGTSIGFALTPTLFSSMADIKVGMNGVSKNDALQKSMAIPLGSLGLAAIFGARTAGLFSNVPFTGVFTGAKLISSHGKPFESLQKPSISSYNIPEVRNPFAVPSPAIKLPETNTPIVNLMMPPYLRQSQIDEYLAKDEKNNIIKAGDDALGETIGKKEGNKVGDSK